LSAEVEQKLIAVALDEHAKPVGPARRPNWQRMVDHLDDRYAAGQMPANQPERFLTQFYDLELTVRPVVAAGEDVPYRVSEHVAGPTDRGEWSLVTSEEVALDDGVWSRRWDGMARDYLGDRYDLDSQVPAPPPGHHTLTLRRRVRLRRPIVGSGDPRAAARPLLSTREIVLRKPFEVVSQPGDALIQWDDRPDLEPAVRRAIRLTEFGQIGLGHYSAELEVFRPPADLAFDVVVRVGGVETELRQFAIARGQSGGFGVNGDPVKAIRAERADIVLRSSGAVARRTVDDLRPWRGEIVFADVAVQREPRPLTAPPRPPIFPTPPASRPSSTTTGSGTRSAKAMPRGASSDAASGNRP
jgi:hypothetical protein